MSFHFHRVWQLVVLLAGAFAIGYGVGSGNKTIGAIAAVLLVLMLCFSTLKREKMKVVP